MGGFGVVGDGQDGEVFAVGAGDDQVLHVWRETLEQAEAERADGDPGAGHELEVLGDAAVEAEAEVEVVRVGGDEGVAEAEIAFIVEQPRGL